MSNPRSGAELQPTSPYYLFVPQDNRTTVAEYEVKDGKLPTSFKWTQSGLSPDGINLRLHWTVEKLCEDRNRFHVSLSED